MESKIDFKTINNSLILSRTEQEILDYLRKKRNQKISIIIREGIPLRLESEEEIIMNNNDLIDKLLLIIEEKKFQKIHVVQKHGNTLLIRRTETVLLNDVA